MVELAASSNILNPESGESAVLEPGVGERSKPGDMMDADSSMNSYWIYLCGELGASRDRMICRSSVFNGAGIMSTFVV